MNEFFPTADLKDFEKEALLKEVLRCLFYLPPSVLKREGVAAKSFKLLPGPKAYLELCNLREAEYQVEGDVHLGFVSFARTVAISERSYKGKTYYVYKLWHPAHPKAATPQTLIHEPERRN